MADDIDYDIRCNLLVVEKHLYSPKDNDRYKRCYIHVCINSLILAIPILIPVSVDTVE